MFHRINRQQYVYALLLSPSPTGPANVAVADVEAEPTVDLIVKCI
jgi:hypothetical protein